MVHWWMGPGGRGLWLWEMGTGRLGLGKQFALGKIWSQCFQPPLDVGNVSEKLKQLLEKEMIEYIRLHALHCPQCKLECLGCWSVKSEIIPLASTYRTTTLQLHYNYTTTYITITQQLIFLPHMGARRSNKKDILNFLKKLPLTF